MTPSATATQEFSFGAYRVSRDRRSIVTDGGAPLRLGGRAFDLLLALLERAGEVVSHGELVARVWPNTIVEETSLRVHVSSLRRAIGDGLDGLRYIENIPGCGYRFAAPVVRVAPVLAGRQGLQQTPQHRAGQMIGRSDALATLSTMLRGHRAVTIVGSGGMGKTTVALALAAEVGRDYPMGAVFVDLSAIDQGREMPGAIANALDLPLSMQDTLDALAQALRDARVLIVLDNCEHVVGAAAELVERLLADTPVSILATSREPLGTEGEWLHRLAPLGLPPRDRQPLADEAMQFPAVELFVARASAASGQPFAVTADNVADVCALAWHLDGSPLAVELVAAYLPTLGLRELRSRVGNHLALGLRGRRTASPRHQTLAATLEWSYRLLSAVEQLVLRRLAVFRGGFALSAACDVAGDDALGSDEVLAAILNLISKSLVCVDTRIGPAEYRLLDTTRTFALQKLREAEPVDPVLRRHALAVQAMLGAADADYRAMSRAPWLGAHGGQTSDVRAALDWCWSATGDLQIGIQVMLNALPLHELGLLAEQNARIELALAHLAGMEPPRPDLELRLHLKLTWPSLEPDWQGRPTAVLLARAKTLAEQLDQPGARISTLYCSWLSAFVDGDYPTATRMAESALAIATQCRDEAGGVLGRRLLAYCRHYTAEHDEAHRLAELTLEREAYRLPPEYASTVPHGVSMRLLQARELWLRGRPDSALRKAEECLALAETAHSHAQLQTLGFALIPITIWRGEFDRAEALVERLRLVAVKGHSPHWGSWAASFAAVLKAMGSRRMPFVQASNAKELDCMASVAATWHHPLSLQRLESGASHWCAAEVLRKQGEFILHRDGPAGMAPAEAAFLQAMELARGQGALAWELRAAMSLARLWMEQRRAAPAHELLSGVVARFSEGAGTADLRAAAELLSACGAPASERALDHAAVDAECGAGGR